MDKSIDVIILLKKLIEAWEMFRSTESIKIVLLPQLNKPKGQLKLG
jgi:hypothetical protein